MDGKHEQMCTSVYKKSWPTPAEATVQQQVNVTQPQNSIQGSYRPTLQSGAYESVVTPLIQPDKYEELYASLKPRITHY